MGRLCPQHRTLVMRHAPLMLHPTPALLELGCQLTKTLLVETIISIFLPFKLPCQALYTQKRCLQACGCLHFGDSSNIHRWTPQFMVALEALLGRSTRDMIIWREVQPLKILVNTALQDRARWDLLEKEPGTSCHVINPAVQVFASTCSNPRSLEISSVEISSLTLFADRALVCSVHSFVARQVIFGTDASLVPPNSWIDLGKDHLSVRVVLNGETLLDAEPVDIPYGELLRLAPSNIEEVPFRAGCMMGYLASRLSLCFMSLWASAGPGL